MIKCYFDGACGPKNPFGQMGVGAIIYKDGEVVYECSYQIPPSKKNSNNVAECLSLEKILLWIRDNDVEGHEINIFGDSNLVISQMKGVWKVKEGLYREHAIRCKQIYQSIYDTAKITFQWIPREQNQIADDLSKGLVNII